MLTPRLIQCLHIHTLMLVHVHILSPIYKFTAQFLTHIHSIYTKTHTFTLMPAHSYTYTYCDTCSLSHVQTHSVTHICTLTHIHKPFCHTNPTPTQLSLQSCPGLASLMAVPALFSLLVLFIFLSHDEHIWRRIYFHPI